MDFSKWNEWDGLWSAGIELKCDQWSWQCDKRGVTVEWLCNML